MGELDYSGIWRSYKLEQKVIYKLLHYFHSLLFIILSIPTLLIHHIAATLVLGNDWGKVDCSYNSCVQRVLLLMQAAFITQWNVQLTAILTKICDGLRLFNSACDVR